MKYGVPIYDSNGRLTGVSYDHDGDGVFDDYEAVVSDPIDSGSGYSVVGSDHDGDGVYDDTTYVAHSTYTQERSSSSSGHAHSSYVPKSYNPSGGSFFSPKEWLKILAIGSLVVVGFTTFVKIACCILALLC